MCWKTAGIVFIVLFLLSLGATGVLLWLYFKKKAEPLPCGGHPLALPPTCAICSNHGIPVEHGGIPRFCECQPNYEGEKCEKCKGTSQRDEQGNCLDPI